MDQTLQSLAEKIVGRFRSTPPPARLLVGVAGIPGSGKSTLAGPLTQRINALLVAAAADGRSSDGSTPDDSARPTADAAIGVSLDGWHHTREALGRFPDPDAARARRGAAFTFDAPSYAAFVQLLRADPPPPEIAFPTFDHALKDPAPSPVPILPSHRIVVIEGLYAFVDDPTTPEWAAAGRALDERIWVDTPAAVARERVVRRNFASGIEPTLEATVRRVDTNDMPNGEWIQAHLLPPTEVVHSLEDATLVSP